MSGYIYRYALVVMNNNTTLFEEMCLMKSIQPLRQTKGKVESTNAFGLNESKLFQQLSYRPVPEDPEFLLGC